MACIPLLAGCISDSTPPLRIRILKTLSFGDSARYSSAPRLIALRQDTGFAMAWTTSRIFGGAPGVVKVAVLDARGEIVTLRENVPPDSLGYSSPLLSAFPSGGFACVWRVGDSVGNALRSPYVQIADRSGRISDPVPLDFSGMPGSDMSVCTPSDEAVVVTITGKDSTGRNGLWTRRFARNGVPAGPLKGHRIGLTEPPIQRPSLIDMPDGGWLLFYLGPRLEWQRFDGMGDPEGPIHTMPAGFTGPPGPEYPGWIEFYTAQAMRDSRLLLTHTKTPRFNIVLGPDDEADTTFDFRKFGVSCLVHDARRNRFFGFTDGFVVLDSSLRIEDMVRIREIGGYDVRLARNQAGQLLGTAMSMSIDPGSGELREHIKAAVFEAQ